METSPTRSRPVSGSTCSGPRTRGLEALGLRVLKIHLVDRDRTLYPADLAIVEDVPGEDLMDLRNRDPHAAEPTMMRLAESLEIMRDHQAPSCGKVALIDAGGTSRWASCEQAALAFALRCLAEAHLPLGQQCACRARVSAGRLDSLDALQTLLELPVDEPVALASLPARLRAAVRRLPAGAAELDRREVTRRAVRPLTIDLAVVRASTAGWRGGLEQARAVSPPSAGAPCCWTALHRRLRRS